MKVQTMEERLEALGRRVQVVERNGLGPPPPPPPRRAPVERVARPVPAGGPAGVERVVVAERAARPAMSLEDLVGGRLLAWAGGVAVLLGLVLLFAIAVSRGWLGEGARTLIGATT